MQNQREFPFGPENGTRSYPACSRRCETIFIRSSPYGSEIRTSTAALPNIPPLLPGGNLTAQFREGAHRHLRRFHQTFVDLQSSGDNFAQDEAGKKGENLQTNHRRNQCDHGRNPFPAFANWTGG
jgi:hypothetical protein